MTNKILSFIVILLIPFVVISFKKNETNFNLTEKEDIILTINNDNELKKIEMEEYIIGVVAAEMPASFSMEALKAQAVASRSFAYYKMQKNNNDFALLTNSNDQNYITIEQMKEKWQEDMDVYYNKIKDAVNSTKGEILTYDGNVIEAFYFAMSNGYTEDSKLVFQESEPYLTSVKSDWDNESIKGFKVVKTINKNEFCETLSINCINITINNINRSNTNRVNSITINNKEFLGTKLRKLLNLRSTDFDIVIDEDNINITTIGYGHGVGMSQYGANGMAKSGYSYEEILKYYYKNVDISKI